MKQVVVFGDLTSDRTSEQYPTIVLCDDCIRRDRAKEEDSQIVNVVGDADDADDACEWC